MDNYGLIIQHLRKLKNLNIQTAANKIGRSAGWLSSVENGNRICRIRENKFNKIIEALDGSQYRPMFKTWVAELKRTSESSDIIDGAILKFVRTKHGLHQIGLTGSLKLSKSYFSKLESGRAQIQILQHSKSSYWGKVWIPHP